MLDPTLFLPGLHLSERFYWEAVRPILDRAFPGLVHAAALLGPGSEVLGYDTPQSTDHHWGPRVQLFLRPEEMELAPAIQAVLRDQLPLRFRGISTHFGPPDAIGVQLLADADAGPINHRVETTTVSAFFTHVLGVDPSNGLTLYDWLTIPEQRLLSVTAGQVFHDGLGRLNLLRSRLAWYPHDLWLLRLAAEWTRISQEEAFVGRCGDVGDEVGSALVAGRLVHSLMRLWFLMARRYAPYAKWFGTAFARVDGAADLLPVFARIQTAPDWRTREQQLAAAYAVVVERHNRLGLTDAIDPHVSPYYGRPYQVIHADAIAVQLHERIADPVVRAIAQRGLGSVDQWVDATDILAHPDRCRKLAAVYA